MMGLSFIVGFIWAVVQFMTPSMEGTLLGLSRDIIVSVDTPILFAFPLVAVMNAVIARLLVAMLFRQ